MLTPGVYVVQLAKDPEVKTSAAGNQYWACEFKVQGHAGRIWDNLSMTEKSQWKVKQFYNAFDAVIGSDTEDMVGETCRVQVGVEIQQAGANKGAERNKIAGYLPKDADKEQGLLAGEADEDDEDEDGDLFEDE